MSRTCPAVVVVLLAAVVAACARPSPLIVSGPGATDAGHGRHPGGVKVGQVSLITEGPVPREEAKRFRDALVGRIEGAFPARDPKQPPIRADLLYEASHSSHRTYIMDYLALGTAGLWPLTPKWGYTSASTHLWLTPPPEEGVPLPSVGLALITSQPYSVVWYSWFRTGPIERAFEQTHRTALAGLTHRIDGWWSQRHSDRTWWPQPFMLRFPDLPPPKGRVCYDFDAQGELTAIRARLGWQLITDDAFYDLPEHGSVREEGQADTTRGFWSNYLRALSGLEFGYFGGSAWVRSEAKDALGERFTIASGNASSEGWKLTLFNPPTRSEVFIYPTVGFFSLDIDIADVAGDIPLGHVAGATDIPAVGSDPVTGAPVDLGAPNVYSLRLRSGYLGQRLGGTAVWGTQRTQLFLTGEGGFNLFEWRYTDVELGAYKESAHSGIFFHSFALRGLLGLVYRPWHIGARCEVNFEFYREFGFPRPMPFEGQVEYDPVLQTYVRREIKVDAAMVQTANAFCGISLVY